MMIKKFLKIIRLIFFHFHIMQHMLLVVTKNSMKRLKIIPCYFKNPYLGEILYKRQDDPMGLRNTLNMYYDRYQNHYLLLKMVQEQMKYMSKVKKSMMKDILSIIENILKH